MKWCYSLTSLFWKIGLYAQQAGKENKRPRLPTCRPLPRFDCSFNLLNSVVQLRGGKGVPWRKEGRKEGRKPGRLLHSVFVNFRLSDSLNWCSQQEKQQRSQMCICLGVYFTLSGTRHFTERTRTSRVRWTFRCKVYIDLQGCLEATLPTVPL